MSENGNVKRLLVVASLVSVLLGAGIGTAASAWLGASDPHKDEHEQVCGNDDAACGSSGEQEPGREEHAEHGKHSEDEHSEDEHSEDEHGEDEHSEDEHSEDEHSEDEPIRLSDEDIADFRIALAQAGPGELKTRLVLPGEVRADPDRLAHVTPRVSGVVAEVNKSLGDTVEAGEVMAVLESRELASIKADYLAAVERVGLTKSLFERERALYRKKISPEQEYLAAKQALSEARIAKRSAELMLHALGLSDEQVRALRKQPDRFIGQYRITAPFDGVVIQKHIVLGERLDEERVAFVVADLSTVWAELSVFLKDLSVVSKGQEVVVSAGDIEATVSIHFVTPDVREDTRSATAIIQVPNPTGAWRPGMFVSGAVVTDTMSVDVLISKSAVMKLGDRTVVFVRTPGGFVPRPVTLGRASNGSVEVVEGLAAGDVYVTDGGFTLKAEIGKGELDAGHAH